MNLEASAIRKVTFYTAAPVETCDRCSAGIKYVALVTYRDGQTQKYGSECINKILDNAPSMRTLFNKNAKLMKRYQGYLKVLSGPVEAMPRGQEYYGSGLYFIGDGEGKEIFFGTHYFFHPIIDAEKNANGEHYVVTNEAERLKRDMAAIAADLPKIAAEISRLELFLAKVLRSVKTAA